MKTYARNAKVCQIRAEGRRRRAIKMEVRSELLVRLNSLL